MNPYRTTPFRQPSLLRTPWWFATHPYTVIVTGPAIALACTLAMHGCHSTPPPEPPVAWSDIHDADTDGLFEQTSTVPVFAVPDNGPADGPACAALARAGCREAGDGGAACLELLREAMATHAPVNAPCFATLGASATRSRVQACNDGGVTAVRCLQ